MGLKVSVITPSYNQAEFLEDTIKSVLVGQKSSNFEYIVIDGGSTDNSVNIIKRYEPYLKYWVSEKDSGVAEAINKGMDKASGDILTWVYSDDMMCRGAIDTVCEIFTQCPSVRWLRGNGVYFTKWGHKGHFPQPHLNKYDFLKYKDVYLNSEGVFWRKDLWDKKGPLDTKYKLVPDFDLWTKFFEEDDIWYVEEDLAGYRFHDTNRAKLYKEELEAECLLIREDMLKRMSTEDRHKYENGSGEYIFNGINYRYIVEEMAKVLWQEKPTITDEESNFLYKIKTDRKWDCCEPNIFKL
jgi:glycosyltransferase involved in cell wall biosynthesis